MGRYDGIKCPVCNIEFKPDDDVVVCPDCGAPHHRDCYEEHGSCYYAEKHGGGEEWRRPAKEKLDGTVLNRCSRCGTVNPPDGIFCDVCGTPLKKAYDDMDKQREEAEKSGTEYNNPGIRPPFVMPYNPHTTPYGGLSPDEEIEGIPVKEIAIFVGANSSYYLPRFKEMSGSKKMGSWNWAAFFGNCLFFFGRGMTGIAILMTLFFVLKEIPVFMYAYHLVAANYEAFMGTAAAALNPLNLADLPPAAVYWATMTNVLNYIYWGSCLIWGMFGNKLYKNHVFSSIKSLKTKCADNKEKYTKLLSKKGGLRSKLMFGLGIAYIAITFFITIFLIPYLIKLSQTI